MPQTTDTAPAEPFTGIFDADAAAINPDAVRSRRNLPVAMAIEAAERTAIAEFIDEDTDRAINQRVTAEHPHMRPINDKPTSQCVYCSKPSVTVRTGDVGNRYGLCTGCATYDQSRRDMNAQLAITVAEFLASEKTTQAADQLAADNDGAREHAEPTQSETEATRRRMLDQWNEVAELAKTRGIHTPAVERFHDEMALLIAFSPDPGATFDTLLNVISRENAKNKATAECPVYPGLCQRKDGEDGDEVDANGRHFDHGSDAITVPSGEMPYEDPEIWAEFVHVSTGVPHIGFMGENLTTGQAREKAAQLRRFADELDALADQVDVAVIAVETRP